MATSSLSVRKRNKVALALAIVLFLCVAAAVAVVIGSPGVATKASERASAWFQLPSGPTTPLPSTLEPFNQNNFLSTLKGIGRWLPGCNYGIIGTVDVETSKSKLVYFAVSGCGQHMSTGEGPGWYMASCSQLNESGYLCAVGHNIGAAFILRSK
jgi:hypothetical protein